jgi:hypothetical protein
MKLLLVIALTSVGCCQGAIAQTSECSTVPKASDRLACYDRAIPPTAAKRPDASKTSTPSNQAAAVADGQDQGPLADLLAVENAKLDSKIKNICRGC